MIPSMGDKIKELRMSKGLSHGRLAKEMGISKSMIGHYENGSRQPSYETLNKIADYFSVSIDYIMGRKSPNTPAFNLDGLTDSQKTVIFAVIDEYRKANQQMP